MAIISKWLKRHEKAQRDMSASPKSTPLKVLWVGRMLDWKCVDTIIRAVAAANASRADPSGRITLTLVGQGPEREHLQQLAAQLADAETVRFLSAVPINEVRALMRSHDVYVLASNEQEGWGAALSEALTEHMFAVGTYEAGASAALLPPQNLYHAGDWRTLAKMLAERSFISVELPHDFTPEGAAERLLACAAAS